MSFNIPNNSPYRGYYSHITGEKDAETVSARSSRKTETPTTLKILGVSLAILALGATQVEAVIPPRAPIPPTPPSYGNWPSYYGK